MSKRKHRLRRAMEQVALDLYKLRAWYDRRIRDPALIAKAEKRLIAEGLARKGRVSVGRGWTDHSNYAIKRTRIALTDKGRDAVWSGELPRNTSEAKSAPRRREKRSRHV